MQTDRTGDVVLGTTTGSFRMVGGIDELAQKVSHLLNINAGEIKWNRQLGLNQREILINGENPALVNTIVNQYLASVFGPVFKEAKVYGNVHRHDRRVDLNMTVTFRTTNAPVHINTTLTIGGVQN